MESQGPLRQGNYEGVISGPVVNTAFWMLMLENGEFWTIYGNYDSQNVLRVTGFIQGTGTSNDVSFTSSNAKDYMWDYYGHYQSAVNGNLSATYDNSAGTFSGTFIEAGGISQFSGGPMTRSTYNYNTPANLADISGSWYLDAPDAGVVVSIDPSGSFTGLSAYGCFMSGNIVPRPSGKNVFNVTIWFSGSPCDLANQTATGIASAYPLSNGRTHLIVAGMDASRSYGAVLFGTR
ncbi:MAG: hypothetical protein LBI87_08255 [Candidatus Accumulibacter sp.]|jgi:hypothetical protein|nr:hypothetical protein [Accumulibacter sp.]